MDKEILRHREFMQTKLERLASERRGGKQQTEQLWLLWRYHHYQVQNFQHERQIHLLVTITFGLIMLGGWAGLLGWLVVRYGDLANHCSGDHSDDLRGSIPGLLLSAGESHPAALSARRSDLPSFVVTMC